MEPGAEVQAAGDCVPGPAPVVRRRRRAVGPPGALAGEPVGWPADVDRDEPAPPPDDDARLLADVPPHHGGH